ncbi:MAG: family 43 glycosylhydrolase [Lachnospiraceae bacterium]|nr:family 43 glycosylhydrolase [Lachnospiraceae bacterium]
MRRKWDFIKKPAAVVLAAALCITVMPASVKKAEAINPIVQDVYTADPAPMACSDGRLYVYTSHDEDETLNGFYTMNDWKCYSTDDMVNWTDHGTVLSYHDFEWAKENSSWAGQVVERDGKFYFYVPINAKNGQTAIGVAVGDSPTGPFTDPLNEPLIGPAPNYIDPTVWVDDDGQAYMYWGNPDLYCVALNEDMISYDKEYPGSDKGIIKWELETNDYKDLESEECKNVQAQFGVGTRMDNGKLRRPTLYEEGPWFYKHDGHYYLVYAANGIPERIDYSMADSPLGPWEYKGMIMDDNVDGKGSGSFTNHPGVVEYKGHSYLFYHTGKLFDGNGYHRSVAVDEIFYNEDGTIDTIPFTSEGVEPVGSLNPYKRVEAETIEYSNSLKAAGSDPLGKYGIEKEPCSNSTGGVNLCDISNDDYIFIRNVDFGQHGAVKFSACTAADVEAGAVAGKIEVYLDSIDGDPVAEYDVKGGGDADTWVTNTIEVDKSVVNGLHDVYMVFTGEEENESLFKFDYWQFTQYEIPPTPAPPNPTPSAPAPQPPVVSVPQPPVPSAPPAKAEVKAPAKVKVTLAKAGKRSMTLKWKKVSGARGYRVYYSTNKSLKKAVKIATVKKTKVTIKKLKKGKTYYARVAAYVYDSNSKKLFGKKSAVVKVKVK